MCIYTIFFKPIAQESCSPGVLRPTLPDLHTVPWMQKVTSETLLEMCTMGPTSDLRNQKLWFLEL